MGEAYPEMLSRAGCHSPAQLAATLPGFGFAYQMMGDIRETPREIVLQRIESGALSLESWEHWGRMFANLLFTRVPLRQRLEPQMLRMGEAVRIVVHNFPPNVSAGLTQQSNVGGRG